jgi:hypothetical protein
MKKFIAAAALLVSSVAFGQTVPTTVGTIPSKGGGYLVFTSVKSEVCKPYQYAMYIRESTGQIRIWGCYIIDGEQLMVEYLDGDFYSYPFSAMTIDPDWENYMKREFTNAGT